MIDLHRHLLGSLRIETAFKLARKYSVLSNATKKAEFEKLLVHRTKITSLSAYIKPWELIRQIIRNVEDIQLIAYQAALDAHHEGLYYVEFRNTPPGLIKKKSSFTGHQLLLNTEDYLNAIKNGFDHAFKECGIVAKINLSIQRHLVYHLSRKDKINLSERYVELYNTYKKELVVGVDLTGIELSYPVRKFEPIFEILGENNINATIHTGETESYHQVRNCIRLLKPKRIAHGLAVAKSKNLMQEIKDLGIAIEMCPTSNLLISSYSKINQHPLFRNLNEGSIDILICTDNPTILNTNLEKELEICCDALKINSLDFRKSQHDLCLKHSFYNKIL